MKVNVFVWKADEEDVKLVTKIIQVIESKLVANKTPGSMEFHINDLSAFEPDRNLNTPIIMFGKMCAGQISSMKIPLRWTLPEINSLKNTPENTDIRHLTFTILKDIADDLTYYAQEKETPLESHVELDSKHTVGVGGGVADIQLSQPEIDNLLKLKRLLKGSKIVLTKGDIRIEVEE